MTVGHMREQMSEREYREWIAYYKLEQEREAQSRIRQRNRAKAKGR